MRDENSSIDTLKTPDEPSSAARILSAIAKAEDYWLPYQSLCDRIDEFYARMDTTDLVWRDHDYDIFWASSEVLKTAIYARVPKPVVAPMFNDRRKLYVTTADVLERSVVSAYEHGGIDEALLCSRDDLIFYNRAALWVNYDSKDGQRICIDHVDRKDFLHPPARKWSEVPWVARRAWMSRDEITSRFGEDAAKSADYVCPNEDDDKQTAGRAGIWEVWHKRDDKVYWVSKGVENILESNKPHYDLEGFYPCPRPAYGTLRPRTLEPRPDFIRYEGLFKEINRLTRRIYDLLNMVRMKGLIPAGGEIGEALEQLQSDNSSASLTIPVAGAALTTSGKMVEWMPLDMVVQAIQGLIEARREFMADFDRLSGISDIMRGETEANETLGAQRMKGQYGSVRVKSKCDEIVRMSRDVTRISAELMAENFTQDTLLDMSQMEVPTRTDLRKSVSEVENAAEEDMKALTAQAQQQPPPQEPEAAQQAQQQFMQAQQQIVAKYAPQLQKLSDQVPIEDVIKLLRDHKARNFAFEIETDSTILTDESDAKAKATEFYTAFTGGMQGLLGAASMGEEAIRVASEVLKYTLSPYRPPRSVLAAIDDFLDAAPEIAQRQAAANSDGGAGEDMAALAEAEMEKARVAGQKVQLDAQQKQMDLQQRQMQMEGEFAEKSAKLQIDQQKLQLQASKQEQEFAAKMADMEAKQNLMQAQTAEILTKIGLDARKQNLEEYKAANEAQARATDQAMAARSQATGEAQNVVDNERANRGEDRADRQQSFAERQPPKGA